MTRGILAQELLLVVGTMWLAHALTLSRIPIAVVFWLTYGSSPAVSLSLVVLAALTDAADGTVARRARRRSGDTGASAGEWLDPLADKVFILVVLAAIQVHDPAPWPLVALIIARELVLLPLAAIYRLVSHGRSEHAFQAEGIGKAATIAELVAIATLIVYRPIVAPLAVTAAALGLLAVIHYILRATHHQGLQHSR
jgi:cardiolipin synthase